MCGHLRVPEAVCRSAAGELHIWCPLHSEGSVYSRFAMLGFMQNASSEELFSVLTFVLCKSLSSAPSMSAMCSLHQLCPTRFQLANICDGRLSTLHTVQHPVGE